MFISKRKLRSIEKRIADLEAQVQGQHEDVFVPEDSNGKHTENESKTKRIK